MKLIFCFDGTSNDPEDAKDFYEDKSISNILKLHLLFGGSLDNQKNVFINQKSFYYSGVGTRGNWFTKIWNAIFAPANGDREDILNEARRDLNNHYKTGDKIYIFGFSRGAALARIFAAQIKEYNPEINNVEFLGVFDTVAAIKGSRDFNKKTFPKSTILFENGSVAEHVRYALHLVSLDENRVMFQPTLFNQNQKVQEIWFSGAHSDVGGGFLFDGLSDITLKFMCDKIKYGGHLSMLEPEDVDYSALVIKDEKVIVLDDVEIFPLSTGVIHTKKRSRLF